MLASNGRTMVRQFLIRILDVLSLGSSVILRRQGPVHDSGWFRSYKEGQPVDFDGEPIPWLPYPVIDFIEKRISPDLDVFEFGCGNSTLWWARRLRRIISVEHDPLWHSRTKANLPVNAELILVELDYAGRYSNAINATGHRFDIVVVDGRDRVNCVRNSVNSLTDRGVIILDNSDRENYRSGILFLEQMGFRHLDITGLIPVVAWSGQTSIFYRHGNCLGI